MNTQTLRDLLNAANIDIVAKNKTEIKASFKVYFSRPGTPAGYYRTKISKTIHTREALSNTDPRIILAAIKTFKPQQLARFKMTREQLESIPFTWYRGSTFIGDTRYTHMSPDEVNVQQALGIKDTHPIDIWIDCV